MQPPEIGEDGVLLHSPDQREREAASARLGRLPWAFLRGTIVTIALMWLNWGAFDGVVDRLVCVVLLLGVLTAANWAIDPWMARLLRGRQTPS